MTRVRTYSELRRFDTFEERYEYLRLGGGVGESTFGFDRYINQAFYRSSLWKQVRNQVIVRDNGCDLGIPDRPINGGLLVHHINPMSVDDLIHHEEWVLNPEYLITTTHDTHNAIHYGDQSLLKKPFTPRQMGDTKLW
jgi:hypothetical protein